MGATSTPKLRSIIWRKLTQTITLSNYVLKGLKDSNHLDLLDSNPCGFPTFPSLEWLEKPALILQLCIKQLLPSLRKQISWIKHNLAIFLEEEKCPGEIKRNSREPTHKSK